MMIISTTDEIMPVVRYDGKMVGNGKPGTLKQYLQHAFAEKVLMK